MKSLFLPEWNAFIRYHELPGNGTTRVYLPGLSTPSLVNFLSAITHPDLVGTHSLLVDYIGSGFSDHSPEFDHSLESHAKTIAAILDHEGLKGCTIIGHSMGGSVGIMLAHLRPDLVSRLIVAEGNLDPGGGLATSQIAALSEEAYIQKGHSAFLEQARKATRKGDPLSAFISGAWSVADPQGLYRSSVALVELDHNFKSTFFQMTIPRSFIYGEQSLTSGTTADVPVTEKLTQQGIKVLVVPNAGHLMMIDNPLGFVDVLKEALHSST